MQTTHFKIVSGVHRPGLSILLAFFSFQLCSAQSMRCSEVYNTIISNYDYKDSASCYGSSMLANVEYYRLDNMGFGVGYIKRNDYDFSGEPYIFCGISSYQWRRFQSSGMTGSWGESFHAYIMDNTCDCY